MDYEKGTFRMTKKAEQTLPEQSGGGGPVEKIPYPVFDDIGPNAPPFSDYFDQHLDTIKYVQGVLAKALNDDPQIMDMQLREAESRLGAMRSIEAWADSYLDVAEHLALGKMPERSSGWTDLDRSSALAAAVARERRFRNVIRGIVESIQTRISYGQSRLRFIERNNA